MQNKETSASAVGLVISW